MMIFKVENKPEKGIKNFYEIEKILTSLKSYGKHSFAVLEKEDSYLQIAGGGCACAVEYCPSKSNKIIFRAYLKEKKVPFEGVQELFFGGGKLKLQPDEFLFISDVIRIFRSYFYDKEFPSEILWRNISYA